ncbi:tRNA 5-methoxyuridine(34)/uridine 5-oxyacetic acid(34) synthase CmoB [Suttonella sp. R2A3]|uniref:tRNA 5-methoxyuridine(34)/uridine 5-oxyacetic acid(34) synthase CmoB n=1 Tax=Suttonella sp. R2A3 TaxID=2908648 RepID=UPI001F3AA624|nr:tRNA 5-methoxyuridine(34)/uridine 5-oxyacetic acid(34) synthase CmoB [Suttonella sp. R2A3]UJF25236.1 tRNA 5-methoxyuridine(34)/uridine 5-oxyacetic acid(34) synthase CmoB [Suttonella sp. R2A3]
MNLAQAQWQNLLAYKTALQRFDGPLQYKLDQLWQQRHSQFDAWLEAVTAMPDGAGGHIDLRSAAPRLDKALSNREQADLNAALHTLMPWRKGPFAPCGIDLDSEWRSDWKFARLQEAGLDFTDKHILDVGCGNGYFMLRMLGEGTSLCVGVDPSWHYFAQFLALQKLYQATRMAYLPLTLDDALLNEFDLTLSMGVLYHRRDPLQHLWQLRETLRSGGQMVVETLVVDGDQNTVFMPDDRYAGMKNVWFLPSAEALCHWLERLKLRIEYCSEAVPTTAEEQRRTPWMDRHSLDQFMRADYRATVEGHPPPKRVIVVASK